MTELHAQNICDLFNQQWPVGSHVYWVANGATIWSGIKYPAGVYLLTNDRPAPEPVACVMIEACDSPVLLCEIIPQNVNLEF